MKGPPDRICGILDFIRTSGNRLRSGRALRKGAEHSTMNARPDGRPPFRADHIGSLLRPAVLRQAFRRHAAGAIADDEFARGRCAMPSAFGKSTLKIFWSREKNPGGTQEPAVAHVLPLYRQSGAGKRQLQQSATTGLPVHSTAHP
jgi:hypothetical protein